MNKEKILTWIQESIKKLEKERELNESLYKDGKNPCWISKENGGLHQPMSNWWGYQSLIWSLENIEKLINKGEFDE